MWFLLVISVVAQMLVDKRRRQLLEYCMGASVALAETVASIGAYELINRETQGVARLEINTNNL